jgi:2'-5' RNA ligase superfamily
MLAWHVLPAGRLGPLAAALTPLLGRPGLTPVPLAWLHLTVRNVGRASAFDAAARRRLVAEAGEHLAGIAPIEAVVGPVRVVEEGVTADVHPAASLLALYAVLPGVPPEPFWPHVTFAYAHAAVELAPFETEIAAAMRIDSVSLLLLRRERQLYCWDVLASLPLSRTDEPAAQPG